MPSFLIVHAACQDGRIDAYRQPPILDIDGMRAPLDWGDVTLHVPAGDLPVTIFVTRTNGQVEGARITVRSPAGTGTRLTFVPPLQPGGQSLLRIDGQWPADSSMHYYAARDARVLARPAQPMPRLPGPPRAGWQSTPQPGSLQPGSLQPGPAQPGAAMRTTSSAPPVGPTPGSTGEVPPAASVFGRSEGARVDPVQPSADAPVQPARLAQPPHLGPVPVQPGGHPHPSPTASFGQPAPGGPGQAPPIPTPEEFHRLEQEAHDAQRRVYEAWQASQHQQPAAPSGHDGAPRPIGLQAGTGQPQPAWYPDPFRRAETRWFDGHQWTSSVMRGGVRGVDQPG